MGKNKIPPQAAKIINQNDKEILTYKISFKYYNDSLCEIDILNDRSGKKALRIFRQAYKLNRNYDFKNKILKTTV